MTAQPFDRIAGDYDRTFTHRRLAVWQREQVRAQVAPLLEPGSKVLELGCGSGSDALWMAEAGLQVTAIDASQEMIRLARQKAVTAGLADRITFHQLDLNEMNGSGPSHPAAQILAQSPYEGIFSNFGVLNCITNRQALAHSLAGLVRTGGFMAVVLMGPICLWELLWFGVHGQFRIAFRRFRSGQPAHVGESASLPVWYPSPRRLQSDLQPHFHLVKTAGIGVLLPPTDLAHLVERWPALFQRLNEWERWLGPRSPWFCDHYLSIYRRR